MHRRDHRQKQRVDRQVGQGRLGTESTEQVFRAFFRCQANPFVLGAAAHDLVGEIPIANELAHLLDGEGAHFESIHARERIALVTEGP